MDFDDDPFGDLGPDLPAGDPIHVSHLPESPSDEEEGIEPAFSNVVDFVEGYLVPVTQVRLGTNSESGLMWDPRWWRHTGVVARLTALWQAWEGSRISQDPLAMSNWWIHHHDPHMRALMDEKGPMSGAPDRSWAGNPRPGVEPAPPELRG